MRPTGDPFAKAFQLLDEALALESSGRHEEAIHVLQEAIRAAHAVGPESAPVVARMLISAATIELRCGRPDGAGGACVQALEFLHWPEQDPPLDPLATGHVLGTMAHVLRVKGKLGEAADAYTHAIRILREHPGEELALVLSNFGALQSHLGATEASRATYDEALRILDEHAPDSHHRGEILLNRGSVESEIGWPSRALSWLEQADEAFRQTGDRDRQAQALHALADARARLDDGEGAAQAISDALALTAADSPEGELHARCLLVAGRLAQAAGRPVEALTALRPAAERFDELAPGSRDSVAAWRAVTAACVASGDVEDAVHAAGAAVRAAEALRHAAALGTPRRGLTLVTAGARDDLIALLLGRGAVGDSAEVVNELEARLARELLDTFVAPAEDDDLDNEKRLRRQALRARRLEFEGVLAHHHWAMGELQSGAPTPMTQAELDQVLANATQGLLQIDQQLTVRHDRQSTLSHAEIVAGLAPHEAVVMTFDSGHDVGVVAITSEGTRAVPLAHERDAVLGDTQAVIEALQAGAGPPAEPLARLSRLLVGWLPAHVTQLMIVSDGLFHSLPWSVLIDPNVPEPLGATRRLVHAASVTTARRLAARHHREAPTRDLLVLADPLYTPEQIDDEDARRLDGTLRELAALQRVVDDVESLTGPEATEANFVERAPLFRRLHLACHGAPDPRDPLFSGLLLAGPAPADADRYSGADDVLQPWQIASLTLACDTVVLSACSSDVGTLRPGEGLVGLAHAFHVAGARQVLTSLWPVGDEATVTIVRDLYNHMIAGLGLAEALRRVRSDHWRTLPPKQWAAWVAHGPDPS